MNYLNQKDGIELLARLFEIRRLVPIFGSGLTQGCKSSDGKVLNMAECRKALFSLFDDDDKAGLKEENIEDSFDLIDDRKRTAFLKKHFTHVNIEDEYKIALLKLDWSCAYTLNFDDGIERAEHNFFKILPYCDLKENTEPTKRLYKLHGDAASDINNKGNVLIFSQVSYQDSISSEKNKDMRQAFLGDYSGRNIVFIGCSLEKESDIEWAYGKIKETTENIVHRILVSNSKADAFKEKRLKQKYGITDILLVDSFDAFYQEITDRFKAIPDISIEKLAYTGFSYPSSFPKINDRTKALEYLAYNNILDINNKTFHMGGLQVERDILKDILPKINSNRNIHIYGNRMCGKTYILSQIIEKIGNRKTFFYPSFLRVDFQDIKKALKQTKNGVFIFDTHSILHQTFEHLLEIVPDINSDGNILILATNRDYPIDMEYDFDAFEIESKFTETEIKLFQTQSDTLGISAKKINQTNVDYLMYLWDKKLYDNIPNFLDDKVVFSDSQKKLLLVLAVCDTISDAEMIMLNVPVSCAKELVKKLPLLVEHIPTELNEARTIHSSKKLIHNSAIFLRHLIRKFKKEDFIGCIVDIVKKVHLANSRRSHPIQKEIMLFDNLNAIWGDQDNSYDVICEIYTSLQKTLNDDLHYWLQRAKSIYRQRKDDRAALKESYQYAMKVYSDSHKGSIINSNAALSLATILYYQRKWGKIFDEDTIRYAEEASHSLRKIEQSKIIKEILEICENYLSSGTNEDTKQKAQNFIDYFKRINN